MESPGEKLEKRIEAEKDPYSAALQKGESTALTKVMKRFDFNENSIDRLPFHNSRHTKDVIRRVDMILSAIQEVRPDLVDAKKRSLGRLAGAFHDTVQKYEEAVVPLEGKDRIMRKRFTVQNEKESADEAVEFLKKANEEANEEIFSTGDLEKVRRAIDATVPGFDPEKRTVIQPNLKEESSIIERAVALADLGTAGIDGPDAHIQEGRDLFREENLDIFRAFEELKNKPNPDPEKDLAPDKVELFKKRMLAWSESQAKFAEGRKLKLEDELAGLAEEAKTALRKIFSRFDETIKAAGKKHEEEKQMPFNELARSFGYNF